MKDLSHIKAVIFDLGAVLIDWNPRYLYNQIFISEDAVSYFLKHICTSEWNEMQDGGRSLSTGTDILIKQFPEYSNEIQAFYGRWTEMIGGAIEETVEILTRLKQRNNVKLFALTNWSAETFPFALENFEFLSFFEDILVSGKEYLKKPDPKIYELALERFDLNAAECIFIDDNLRNVDAANALGIKSVHFVGADQLSKEIGSLL